MNKITLTFLSICCYCLSMTAIAQALSPETYIKADLEARRVTLAGMEARLVVRQRRANLEEEYRQAEENHQSVKEVFARYGVTGASHAAYGTQNREAIAAWLENNPEWQAQYDEIKARFVVLSNQFDELSQGR
jgi:hypothetical protein